jgi:hypothetical protein
LRDVVCDLEGDELGCDGVPALGGKMDALVEAGEESISLMPVSGRGQLAVRAQER